MKSTLFKSTVSIILSGIIVCSGFSGALAANTDDFKTKGNTVDMLDNAAVKTNSIVGIPNSLMSVSANSANPGYLAENAVDGYTNTIWHSEWSPQNDPFPHIFTISLCKKLTLNEISILPRQDASAGKTTSGQIYAGDSLDDMTLVTAFTGDTSKNATVVDLKQTKAKYIQIYSLKANSANTAIAEINITTPDNYLISAFSNYYTALDLLQKATVGTNVGDYLQSDVNDFKISVESFLTRLGAENLSNEDYQTLGEEIARGNEAFLEKAKSYGKADLKTYTESLSKLNADITAVEDKAAANALLQKANGVYSNENASKAEIHNIIIELLGFINAINAADKDVCSLSGEWNLDLNAYSSGMQLSDKINLPGTLDTNKKGTYNKSEDINRLSRYYKYTGPATYQKQIYVSKEWSQKNIVLYMERSRETRVWVNGVEVKSEAASNVLPVSQSYDISKNLNFGGYNTVTIVVDNSYPNLPAGPINASHMATDETQTNWNGILGKFEFLINDKTHIDDLRVYPNDDLKSVRAEIDVKNTSASAYSGNLTLSCPGASDEKFNVQLKAGEAKTVAIDFAMPADVKLWSEFENTTYKMKASLDERSLVERDFGMRVFSKAKESDACCLKINGKKVFLRNETNCAVFPLTGYAPMDTASWEKLFTTYKSYGINSVRFHSWCPPDAAFSAADKLGLYLQPELSSWDGGMFDNSVKKNYYTKEAYAIVKEYANHPSFVMLSFGNELNYSTENYQYADRLIKGLKEKDGTRLYAPGSNIGFGGFTPTANTDYFTSQFFANEEVRGSYGGLREGFVNQKYPSSDINYNETLKKVFAYNVPFFSFEVGQYQVFPDVLTEPDKYNGVLEARNFKIMADKIKQKGLSKADVSKAINASGMLSRIAYKAEIEAALRTKDMSGISLLGIQDFSGQGTALVGMVNALGEPKPYDFAAPDEFTSFFSPTVVLFETSKFCYTNKEALTGNILLSNYSRKDISGEISYKLSFKDGGVFYEGKTNKTDFKQGDLTKAAKISVPLDSIKTPTQLKLEVSCMGSKNNYNIWVYPDKGQLSDEDVYVADYLDDAAAKILENGGKVLLSPRSLKTAFPESLEGRFSTAFWSTNDKAQPGTMGLALNPEHPLFKEFPTDYYSDYQWWAMARYGRPMNLEDFKDKDGKKIEPLVKVLDGYEDLNNLGLLYEAKAGGGKIMVSSINFDNLKYEYPEVMAFRNAVIKYMNSDDFNPKSEVDVAKINDQVKSVSGDKNNLALGKNVFNADAINSSAWSEENLTDGVAESHAPDLYGYSTNNTYPLSSTDCDAGFTIDLSRATEFNQVVLYPRTDVAAAGSTRDAANFPRTFEIQASDDLDFATYETLSVQTNVTTTIDAPLTIKFDKVAKRYVRLFVKRVGIPDAGDSGRVQLAEFEIYNSADFVPVTGITLNQSAATLKVGESKTLSAKITPENASERAIVWSSSNSAVAAVDQTGKVTAIKRGSARIIAAAADGSKKTASCDITVTAVSEYRPVNEVKVKESKLTITKGKRKDIVAFVLPYNATDKRIRYTSGNSSIAAVSGKTVIAKKVGTTYITVSSGGRSQRVKITVKSKVTNVLFKRKSVIVRNKKKVKLTSYIKKIAPTKKYRYKTRFTWITSDKKRVKVNNKGVATRIKKNKRVTIRVKNGKKTLGKLKLKFV